MELQAMRTGRRPVDDQVVGEILAARIAEARSWDAPEPESVGPPPDPAAIRRRGPRSFEAQQRYAAIVEDFDGLATDEQLAAIAARAAELEATDEVREALALVNELVAEEVRGRARYRAMLGRMHTGDGTWNLAAETRELGVGQLHASAADTSRPAQALVAQRTIEALFVQSAFYQPQGAMWAGEPERALHFLELADVLQPGTARVPRMMATAHAQLGDAKAAVGELRRAHAIVPLTGGQLRGDSELDPIRQTPEFREFMERLTTAQGPRPPG